jgi:hypothetical protein
MLLHATFCLLVACALWEIYGRGYPMLCLLLAVPSLIMLYRLRRDPGVGSELYFGRGLWTLQGNGVERAITLRRRCVVTPWVIYLAFNESTPGAMQQLWLYVDAVQPQQWRRLRVRLTLLR